MRTKLTILLTGCMITIAMAAVDTTTLQVGSPSVVLMAGQTVEIPLSSDLPIASDLTASGAFQPGDVTFMAGPGCHLSANGCTLLITAAPTSLNYMAVPVTVSESAAMNKPIFSLSVINAHGYAHSYVSKINSLPVAPFYPMGNKRNVAARTAAPHAQHSMKLTAGNLTGTIMPHSQSSTYYTSSSNGPVYQMINVTNNGSDNVTLETPTIGGTDASFFSIDTNSADYQGVPAFYNNALTLTSGASREIIIKSTAGNPSSAPKTATLTIGDGVSADTLRFTLTDTTYVYAAGGFNTLGNATVSGSDGDLLAQCTAGTCSNALQGTTGNNYASENFSVGAWINAMAVTPTGNLIVGGVFGAVGGATSGATAGKNALLAQCTPGAVSGNACINQMSGITSPYAFSNGYIDAITIPSITISNIPYIAVGGDFSHIRIFSTLGGGRMLAKCAYNATTSSTCSNYLNLNYKYANNAITALDTLGSASNAPQVNVGGLFTQIADYPSSLPQSGTTFASCTSSNCTNGMGAGNPNNSILGMIDDGTNLYMGGTFTQIGGYTDATGGYPLVKCTLATNTTCINALAGTLDANGYIEGLTYSGGDLYVGGRFTAIGGATPVSGGNMLAVCTPEGQCSNFVADTNPYATGVDEGGMISAIAVGNQTTITVG